VLDTLRGDVDPSAVRALTTSTLLIYDAAIAFTIDGAVPGRGSASSSLEREVPPTSGVTSRAI
jgi:hypothetical protein